MKRISAALLALLAFSSARAVAEDSVSLIGNYYKERSTRVYEPILRVEKEIPGVLELEGTFAVDQVTSASGAFTPTDEPFNEFREEIQLAVRKKILGFLKPGIIGRLSYEPDYTSGLVGLDLLASLARDTTTLRTFFLHQRDDVRARGDNNFNDALATSVVGLSAEQLLSPTFFVGASVETQILRGYQENFYRVETHPRARNRYTAAVFAAYHLEPSGTTGRATYRFYGDTWELFSHTLDFEVSQELSSAVEVTARFRYYTQDEVFFARGGGEYQTQDPKLFAFNSELYGIGFRFVLGFLDGVASALARSVLEPRYTLMNQHNLYGVAHVVQLAYTLPL